MTQYAELKVGDQATVTPVVAWAWADIKNMAEAHPMLRRLMHTGKAQLNMWSPIMVDTVLGKIASFKQTPTGDLDGIWIEGEGWEVFMSIDQIEHIAPVQ